MLPGQARTFVFMRMGDVPEEWRARLHELSFGPYNGTMVRWSYHNGDTWALILFEGGNGHPRYITGWSCITLEEEPHAVVGVYVDPDCRGGGRARQLVSQILSACHTHIAVNGGIVLAVGENYPKYEELISQAGFTYRPWQ